mmetsp:Transcript_8292/g.9060  ORF Transcript_8292/g.9060 Transcript_8292/m.9060 type:complete len:231 (+) Transcript_8292:42-734(+)|eukprot:CAMPEP_0173155682 /NCGR_PEP_ID=MMETSP1105-20130129/14259_1 /TAXON_ID=2985 /ORGANISM="Ochromonas sp., Strain BG-1" /LENGTH=230 /DNA_ID=CAMNT_0014072171 /DNA_START=38 /DNA_END=730 /DNA_ORIENTATION=+
MEGKSAKSDENNGSKSPVPATKPKRERRKTAEEGEKDTRTEEPVAEAVAKPRRRRADDSKGSNNNGGGWMTVDGSSNPRPNLSIVEEEEAKPTTTSNNKDKDKYFAEGGDEILVIPDLEEDGGGDSDQRIAHAPRNIHRKIPTLAELEADAKNTIASTNEDGLKLQVLISSLVPPDMLQEPDLLWTFESLLREITDELSDVPKPIQTQKPAIPPKATENPKTSKKTQGSK